MYDYGVPPQYIGETEGAYRVGAVDTSDFLDLDSDDDSTPEALASPMRFQASPMLTRRPRQP